MDASTTGPKASTRKPRVGKPDRHAAARRARVVQVLFMQAALAAFLLVMAAFSWRDTRMLLLLLLTLLVPAGFAYALWTAYRRDQAARDAGTWTPESDKAERRRMFTVMAVLGGTWIVLAGATMVLL